MFNTKEVRLNKAGYSLASNIIKSMIDKMRKDIPCHPDYKEYNILEIITFTHNSCTIHSVNALLDKNRVFCKITNFKNYF